MCRKIYCVHLIAEVQRRHMAAMFIQKHVRGHNTRWKYPCFSFKDDDE